MIDRFEKQSGMLPRERVLAERATVAGVGAIGRQVALQLASIGVMNITIVDFDVVDDGNITSQGYLRNDVGRAKVACLADAIKAIDPVIEVTVVQDKFRSAHAKGDGLFCCVDSIAAREQIWQMGGRHLDFWCDGRMHGEVIRVLAVSGQAGREYYPTTFFGQDEAHRGTCTTRSTIYASGIAAGLMVHQFTRYLRGISIDPDLSLNLLASDLVIPELVV